MTVVTTAPNASWTPAVVPGGRSWVSLMQPAVELAKAIAGTEFVPKTLRNNPAAISAAILYGDEVGLGPMQALAKIAVIDGRPYVAAEAQRALVYAAGHDLWLEDSTTARVTWCGRRAGSDVIVRVTWTTEDARRAHLADKPNWRTYPRQMLSARASAELVRALFADVVGGLGATEEYEDTFDVGTGRDVGADRGDVSPALHTRRSPRSRRARPETSPVTAGPAALPPLPTEVATAAAESITDPQRRRMHAEFRRLGVADRGERLRMSSEVVGRKLGSSAELTVAEAGRLIEYLETFDVDEGSQRGGSVDDDGGGPAGESDEPEGA